jgi:hypothetical protein
VFLLAEMVRSENGGFNDRAGKPKAICNAPYRLRIDLLFTGRKRHAGLLAALGVE